MKKSIAISILSSVLFLLSTGANAAGGHGGGGSSISHKTGGGCKSTVINHFTPKHLSKVDAGSEFSFSVKGIKDPGDVEVTAKKIPVKMSFEEKSDFFAFKGNLPESLKSAARVRVKVNSKKCPAEKGVLLIINK
ncbi:MAG: hypothetical protein GQ475_02695 [Methylococcaceae bacterium]|nr:hypothetical protein [Methylococcaceae bacterium]